MLYGKIRILLTFFIIRFCSQGEELKTSNEVAAEIQTVLDKLNETEEKLKDQVGVLMQFAFFNFLFQNRENCSEME